MEIQFKAKLDNLSKIISIVVVGVIVASGLIISGVGLQSGHPEMIVPPVLIALALGITALFAVTGYSLDEQGLHIHRRAGIKSFPREQLLTVQPVTQKELGFGLRAFGSGGYLGWFGLFAYRNIGKVTLFATDREKFILLPLQNGKQIIISPENPAAFLQAAKKSGLKVQPFAAGTIK